MDTLLLDRTFWDLCLDSSGNIAKASRPYAIAQDVASAIKLFNGELWYDTSKGVPYFTKILGQRPPIAYMKEKFIEAAESVPEVKSAKCFINSVTDREVKGQVQITDTSGNTTAIGF